MTAYPGKTRTTLGKLCDALWEFQSRPVVIQPGIEPGSVVMPPAMRCSALDRCATREPNLSSIIQLLSLMTESINTSFQVNVKRRQPFWPCVHHVFHAYVSYSTLPDTVHKQEKHCLPFWSWLRYNSIVRKWSLTISQFKVWPQDKPSIPHLCMCSTHPWPVTLRGHP